MRMLSVCLISLALSTVKATTVSSDGEHGKNLVDWLRLKGGTFHSNLEIRRADPSNPTSRFGMFASDKIVKGEILLDIPSECLLIPGAQGEMLSKKRTEPLAVGDEVLADFGEEGALYEGQVTAVYDDDTVDIHYVDGDEEDGVPAELVKKVSEMAPTDSEMECGTTYTLIQEMKLSDDSELAPYANYLLDQSPGQLPSAWSDTAKELLTKVVLHDHLPPLDPTGWSYIQDCNPESSGSFEENAAMMVVQRSWGEILIPVYDMMSHRNGKWLNTDSPKVNSRSSKSKSITVRASRDIEAGDEIYTTYNFCSDCGGRATGYGTPEILRDYGFVEEYPQRWFFLNDEVAFELDEEEEVVFDDSGTRALKVTWIGNEPTKEGIAFCEEQLTRLTTLSEMKFKSSIEGVSNSEWDTITQYIQALITAMTHAIDAANSERLEQCVLNKSNQCSTVNGVYSDLGPTNSDHGEYHSGRCTEDRTMEFPTYDDTDSIQSAYQLNSVFTHPENKDTCFDLDNTIQICGSFRPHYHEMVVHNSARYLDEVKRIVFVGGGDSMLLHEIVKYPSLELVVGLEIDQKVTRSSFKHFGTQPHWDDEKVQWWYGDAAKSLLMLPKDYFASFDMVLVDLSETVMSITVTDGLDIFGALSLLLKPEGIIVKNEPYLGTMSQLFDYTTQVHFYNVPVICSQALILASNNLDFLNRAPKDHNIENLYLKPLDEIKDKFGIWHSYRNNNTRKKKNCKVDDTPIDEAPVDQAASPGILIILEAEDATGDLSDPQRVKDTLVKAIEEAGLTVKETVVRENDNKGVEVMLLLREGYILVRTWPEQKYCAFDIQLWSTFEKHDNVRKAMIAAVGSNRGKSSSSYRIVVGGMFGASTWQDDEKNRGPIVTESCDRPVEPSRDARMDEGDFANVLEESMALMVENDITVAVICGNETQSCTSLDAISKSGNVGEVVAVWTCPSITSDNNEYKENELGHMLDCQKKILKKLKKSTSKEKKIRAIIIDESAPFEMGRIVYNIFESENNREHIILDETIMVLAAALDDTENWRKNLIERFRVDFFPEEPSFTAVVQFKSSESTMGLSITSSGDPTFFQGLVGVTGSIEKRTGLMADVRNVDGGQFRETDYIDDETYQFFLPGDYDQRSPLDQWTSQQPMGRQTVFQLEIDFNKLKEGMLSATIIKRALEATFLLVKAEIMNNSEVHGFTDVGDGSVVIGFWQGGSAAVLWDGKLHVDINLFTYSENVEIHREFETGFKSQILSLKTVLKDEQPRGYGRVVNFSADVEPRADAHWALGIKDE